MMKFLQNWASEENELCRSLAALTNFMASSLACAKLQQWKLIKFLPPQHPSRWQLTWNEDESERNVKRNAPRFLLLFSSESEDDGSPFSTTTTGAADQSWREKFHKFSRHFPYHFNWSERLKARREGRRRLIMKLSKIVTRLRAQFRKLNLIVERTQTRLSKS